MTRGVTRAVFAAMFREEWRLHSALFGDRRFAAFPLFVTVVATGAVWALVETGTPAGSVVAGVHALAFGFGLHTGSIGFVGRDALRGLLEEVSLVMNASTALPVSRRRLIAVFLVKDAVYYAVIFLAPIALAFGPVLPLARVPLLWLSTSVTFALGATVTFAVIALSTRGLPGRVVALGSAAAAGLAWVGGVDPLAASPYALYDAPLSADAGLAVLAVPTLAAVAVATYDADYVAPARTAGNGFAELRDRLPVADGGLVAKSLLDVARSSGGLWKVVFSAGVLFAVGVGLVGVVERVTGVAPSLPVSLGALLGLTGVTSYNWLTQFDGPETYTSLPVSTGAVLRAKFRAFLVVGPPAAALFYAAGVAWSGGGFAEVVVGALLLGGLLAYLFGLTVALTGLRPNEFLFDTALFAGFAAGVAVPLVPVLVVGFVLAPYDATTLAALVVASLGLAAAGHLLYRRSVPRWERRYRAE